MMLCLFVILCLFRFLMKDRNLVKWASWPPTTVKSLTECLYRRRILKEYGLYKQSLWSAKVQRNEY